MKNELEFCGGILFTNASDFHTRMIRLINSHGIIIDHFTATGIRSNNVSNW
ncbi:hypothetical protein CHS0354_025892 [Potamilus streckersoni]|uniref:Uncharacterized protein n=1 Tax=Potamilus streckersoni TaxID=2493646 RepID=A0AAE0TJ59_9BIVA|nr:hypothetical protein CHS0354_025892 [Potamilus streckersoni]